MPQLKGTGRPLSVGGFRLKTASPSSNKRKAKQHAAQYLAKRKKLEGQLPIQHIAKLPVEIWQDIASLLPLHAQIALSQSCLPLRQFLGTAALTVVRTRVLGADSATFLKRRNEQAKAQAICTLGKLPKDIWEHIMTHLPIGDKAALIMASNFLYRRLRETPIEDRLDTFTALERPVYWRAKLKFLFNAFEFFDPDTHELCDECVVYHGPRGWVNHAVQDKSIKLLGPTMGFGGANTADVEINWDQVNAMAKAMRITRGPPGRLIEIADFAGDEDKWETHANFGMNGDRCMIACISRRYLKPQALQENGDDCPSVCQHFKIARLHGQEKSELVKQVPRPWEEFDSNFNLCGKLWRCTR